MTNKYYEMQKDVFYQMLESSTVDGEKSEEYIRDISAGVEVMIKALLDKGFLEEHTGLVVETDEEGEKLVGVHMAYKGLPVYDESVVSDYDNV